MRFEHVNVLHFSDIYLRDIPMVPVCVQKHLVLKTSQFHELLIIGKCTFRCRKIKGLAAV